MRNCSYTKPTLEIKIKLPPCPNHLQIEYDSSRSSGMAAWRLPGRWPDGGRRSTVARWTRGRAAPAYAPIPDLPDLILTRCAHAHYTGERNERSRIINKCLFMILDRRDQHHSSVQYSYHHQISSEISTPWYGHYSRQP